MQNKFNLLLWSAILCAIVLCSGCRNTGEGDDGMMWNPKTITYLCVASVADTTTRTLVEADHAIFIPGTTRILYTRQDSLFTINCDSSQRTFIGYAPGIDAYYLTISPDGRTVLATSKGTWIKERQRYWNSILKIDLTSRSGTVLYANDSTYFWRPRFLPGNSKIIINETPRGGPSLLGLDGSGYSYLENPLLVNSIYLGTTAGGKLMVMKGRSYSGPDTTYTTLLTVSTSTFAVVDSFYFPGDYIEWETVRITDDMKLYYKTRTVIAKYDLASRTRTVLYSRYMETDLTFSTDLSKAVFMPVTSTPSILDLTTGQLTPYVFADVNPYSYHYSQPQFSQDDKFFLILRYQTVY